MHQLRTTYFVLVFAAVIFGLLSRHFHTIPSFIGDVLWALMVYFIVRFVFTKRTLQFAIVNSLLFSYAIECSQLYHASWINEVRRYWIGHMILGIGFLWSDLLCYTAGVALGVLLDKKLLFRSSLVSSVFEWDVRRRDEEKKRKEAIDVRCYHLFVTMEAKE